MRLVKVILMISVVMIVVSCVEKKEAEIIPSASFYTSFTEAKAAVATTDKPIVIDFYTDW
ncbi:MAG: hypothetical protein ACE5D6_08740 [Candidatus Zixiibacteriota bacterium]